MKIHGQSLESLYKDVPMRLLPVEYLPDDYNGPNAGTEKEIIGTNKPYITWSSFADLLWVCYGRTLLSSFEQWRLMAYYARQYCAKRYARTYELFLQVHVGQFV